jgi:hypothetical protein
VQSEIVIPPTLDFLPGIAFNHPNRSRTSNEIKGVIKSLPPKKSLDLMDSWLFSTRPLRKN